MLFFGAWGKMIDEAKNLVTCPFKKAGIADLNSVNVTLGVHECPLFLHYNLQSWQRFRKFSARIFSPLGINVLPISETAVFVSFISNF
jgi:hypothetical protein